MMTRLGLLLALSLFMSAGLLACQSASEPAEDVAGEDAAGDTDAVADPVADPEADEAVDPEPDPVADPEADDDGDEGDDASGEADSSDDALDGSLIIYSGRSESLVGPLIEDFEKESGIDVSVRWAGTAELAATLLEEGDVSPADLYFAQDPGGLGAVSELLSPLPDEILSRVDSRFRDPEGHWVGISGRARVVVYNTDSLSPEDLPETLAGFTDPAWKGRIGWAPTNGSFQTMVTAMRAIDGEEATRAWLEGILANDPMAYDNNTSIVAAVGAGEVEVGLVNHYYLHRFLAEEGLDFPARNHYLTGEPSLVMVAGAGILKTAENRENAEQFLAFLLSKEAQQYFATETFEYPLIEDDSLVTDPSLTPLADVNALDIELSELADLPGTAALLSEVGVLP
jgi:iron(III) transport system substrate-binding protein